MPLMGLDGPRAVGCAKAQVLRQWALLILALQKKIRCLLIRSVFSPETTANAVMSLDPAWQKSFFGTRSCQGRD